MPKTESTQHKLSRVRAPRVHITYDVEVGNAIEAKELPFVVGVLGDFSGKPDEPLPRVKERKFIEIDRDNFDKVLAAQKPRLAFSVADKLSSDPNKRMNVELRFGQLDDFEPDRVVRQIEPLRKLVETRRRLSDLMSKMDGNDKLEGMLSQILNDSGARSEVSKQLGLDEAAGGGEKEGEG
jgi:type VI secretion system protein ImpB